MEPRFMLTLKMLPNGLRIYVSLLLEQAGIPHAFSTRVGGVSQGKIPGENPPLDLGPVCDLPLTLGGDWAQAIGENYRRLETIFAPRPVRRVWANQVHGGQVLEAALSPQTIPTQALGDADALVTGQKDLVLTIRVADCVPILLADRQHRAVAAVHAGWRGLVGGIIPNTLRHLRQQYRIEPHDLLAAVGPAISVAHFEVGQEVAQAFEAAGLGSYVHRHLGSKPHVDLPGAARGLLEQGGLSPDRIDACDRCTFRDQAEFFSHRRDRGITGRMAAVIALAAQA